MQTSGSKKPITIFAHIHTIKYEYEFGQAETPEEAQAMIEDFFGPNPDPEIVTIRLED